MAIRFQVVRGFVYFRKRAYYAGELMPEGFTDRDRARNVYSRRLERVEIPDQPTMEGNVPELELELEPVKSLELEVAQEIPQIDENMKSPSDLPAANTMVPKVESVVMAKAPATPPQKLAPKSSNVIIKK